MAQKTLNAETWGHHPSGHGFLDAMNDKFSPTKIGATVTQLKKLVQQNPPFEVGKFNKDLLQGYTFDFTVDWSKFQSDFNSIPSTKRHIASVALWDNFNQTSPLPVNYIVRRSSDGTADVMVHAVTINGQDYIEIIYVCKD